MPVQYIYSNPKVRQNINHVAIQRGPIVYCLESVDNIESLQQIGILQNAEFDVEFTQTLLDGVVKIKGDGIVNEEDGWGNKLYKAKKPKTAPFTFTAIPYYAWDNRDPGQMRVWIYEVD